MLDRLRRLLRNLVLLVAVAAPLIFSASESARAQSPVSDFFGGLFGGFRQHRPQYYPPVSPWEGPRVRRLAPHGNYGAPAYWHSQSRAAKKSKAKKPAEPAVEPSFFVAVIGDSLGQMLANGLDEAYADRPEIRILHKAKESSGLVRDDFYDWPKAVRDLLASGERVDMAVMMIGSNDRQAIHDGTATHEPFSPRWRELYAARVEAIRAAFREKKILLVWVGLPVMKSEHFSADMAQLNEIYLQSAAQDGAVCIDLWEAFADERSQYEAFGPDINGRIVKLRSGDGVHFTDDGARKVAHFVEGEIKRAFEASRPPAGEAGAEPGDPPGRDAGAPADQPFVAPGGPQHAAAPSLPERPAVGPVQSLTAPAAAPNAELARRGKQAGVAEPRAAAARALVEHIFGEGRDPAPQPGRADDFSWPKNEASGVAR